MILKRILQSILIVAVLMVSLAATTQSAKASSYCGPTYVVQPGDWLAKIARYCGVSTSALIAANPWTQYYYYIYPGQVLNIPDAYYPPPRPHRPRIMVDRPTAGRTMICMAPTGMSAAAIPWERSPATTA